MTEQTDLERRVEYERSTDETDVSVSLNIDGDGDVDVETGIPVFDHFLTAFAYHGRFDLQVDADGDLDTGVHHTVEDTAITLGEAFHEALGDRHGIERFEDCRIPLDEAVAEVTLDVSGRPHCQQRGSFSTDRVDDLPSYMIRHFFNSLAVNAAVTLHTEVDGENTHHEGEALFKAVGRALDVATRRVDARGEPPSTKGTL